MEQKINYITPAVTPLLPDGEVDLASSRKLYRHLLAGGVDGILILGSIGEFFGLRLDQKKALIRCAGETVQGRCKLLAGTTSMVYGEIVELSNYALEQGADAAVIIPPYYFHFTDESVFAYYDMLAKEIHGNIYLYNFPERTGYEISAQVVKRLALTNANIVGIKDTIGGFDHTRELIQQVKPVRPDFEIYSGFDDNFMHNVLCGGNGCIAGLSNLYPELTSSWVHALRNADLQKAAACQRSIDRLMRIYSVGKPFVPFMKAALAGKGIIQYAAATKPMPTATREQLEQLNEIMAAYENEQN
ncbi:MAG: dihydrodipicolinate synthase family protein [Oscillospiraceae bacterium]|nr:dihydrodipicolinate synthase family protein [Oscillospiraceae bacterium]